MPFWVQFVCRVVDRTPASVILKATDGSGGAISVNAADVRVVGDQRVELRVGTRVYVLSPPDTQRQSGRDPMLCHGQGTCCIGSTEYCCDTGELIGSCDDFWRCP
jgi:uncharacterized protein (DUF779 family)